MNSSLEENPISLLLALQETRAFVIGDAILDTYIIGNVTRISPEAPVPVIHEGERKWVPGGAANVATNVAAFGAKAWLCARVGLDADGDKLLQLCHAHGIETSAILRSVTVPTITKTRLLAGYQQIVRIDNEFIEELPQEDCRLVLKRLDEFFMLEGPKVVVISDYSKGFLPANLVREVISASQGAGVPVVTDPKSLDISRYSGSTIIKPNLKDGREILRALHPSYVSRSFDSDVEAMCDCYLKYGNVRNVVLSLSEKGVLVSGKDTPGPVRIASRALQVADVSGAGDTMVAFIGMAISAGFSVEEAAQIGNVASGVACGKPGTATVSSSEFMEAIRASNSNNAFVTTLSLEDAAQIAARERQAGKRIVFTNGCFDILHAGHVRSLQQAQALGDVLFVGLNSDSSIRRLKGPSRPIQCAADRAMILSALSCVDFVVEFDADTPIDLILAVRPDIIAKGGDYSADDIVGAQEVRSWGGRVEIIPLLEGRSTTAIVARGQIR